MFKLAKFFLLSGIFLIVFLFLSPLFLDKKKIISFINQEIESSFEQKISYNDDVDLTFFPFPKITISQVKYFDPKVNLNIFVDTLKVSSSWASLLKFKPTINFVELVAPNINYKSNKFSKFEDLSILIANSSNTGLKKISSIIKVYEKLTISKGTFSITTKGSKQIFNSINLTQKNYVSGEIRINGKAIYQNFPSNIVFDLKTSDFKNIKFEISNIFKEKNKITTSGNLILNNQNLLLRAKAKSKLLNIGEIFSLGNKLVYFLDKKTKFKIKTALETIDIKIDVAIEKISFKSQFLNDTHFQIVSNNKILKVIDLKSQIRESKISSSINYEIIKKKISGLFSIDSFFLSEEIFGKTKYDIFGGLFDCSFSFQIIDVNKDFTNFLKQLEINGTFNSGPLKFKGIDFEKVSKKVDEADTFLKFANLIDEKSWSGFSKIESLKGKVKARNGTIFLKDVKTIQKNVKVNSNGEYNLINEKFNIKNRVLVSTEKYNKLPEFGVNVFGKKNDYKVSYNLDKIRDKIFSVGIEEILKDKKKIIIDPKSIKKLFKKNGEDSINPEKILDLFLN